MSNLYLNVLLESARVASIIPMSAESTFFAMISFGGFNLPLAFLMAVLGGVIGHTFNLVLGRVLLALKRRGKFTISEKWYGRMVGTFDSWGVFVLVMCWAPLANILVVIAGFAGVKWQRALPVIALGLAAHYGWYLR